MEAKKHPALLATLVVLGLAALTGVVFAGRAYYSFSGASRKLAGADAKVDALLKNEIALTKENVSLAASNLEALKAAEVSLREEISGAPGSRFEMNYSGAPGDLGAVIKDSVEGWRNACRSASVVLAVPKPDDFAFGFSRYFQTGATPPAKFTREIHRQTRVVDSLVHALLESKLRDDLRLVSVAREPVELAGVARGNFNPDEVDPSTRRDSVFRRDGLVRSEFFTLKFVSRTDVLRRFINAVSASGRSLAVRGLEVSVPSPELLVNPKPQPSPGAAVTLPADLFGPAPAAPGAPGAPGADAGVKSDAPVVADAPSLFTVTLEFIEVVSPETAAPAESANK